MNTQKNFEKEVKQGERFQFGKNWQKFISVLNDERINEAEKSLKTMLKKNRLPWYRRICYPVSVFPCRTKLTKANTHYFCRSKFRKKKVVFLIRDLNYGGVQRQLVTLVNDKVNFLKLLTYLRQSIKCVVH
jgi:hypothetical protein